MPRPIAVDLFAGAGGFSLGVEQAGFDLVAAVEVDPIHCATHEFNFPQCSTLCFDAIQLTGQQIRQLVGIGDRPINLVVGGPPCQGFSLMGKRQIDDPRNDLVLHFVRLVVELKAHYFILENVPGLAAGQHKQFLEEVFNRFEVEGYLTRSPVILNAAHYGVPQTRKRLFLVGCKQGLSLAELPKPITWTSGLKCSLRERLSLLVTPTIWDAIGDLPNIESYPELLHRDWTEPDKWRSPDNSYATRLRWGGWNEDNSYPRQFNAKILTNSKRTQHGEKAIARFTATPQGKKEPVSHFHKLNPNGLCPTLRAGTGSDRGRHTAPRPIHPYTPRCITVREAARLHSYPDWFRFHPTIWNGFRQVGNSLPPLFARAVASEIIRALPT